MLSNIMFYFQNNTLDFFYFLIYNLDRDGFKHNKSSSFEAIEDSIGEK